MLPTRLAVVLLALAAAACSSPSGVALDRSMAVPIHDRSAVSGAPFAVRFAGVPQDSRCPAGAMCIWAGDAAVQVDLVAPGDSVRATLHTNPSVGAASVAFHDYLVELVRLDPWPEVGRTIDPGAYVATLRVSRR